MHYTKDNMKLAGIEAKQFKNFTYNVNTLEKALFINVDVLVLKLKANTIMLI